MSKVIKNRNKYILFFFHIKYIKYIWCKWIFKELENKKGLKVLNNIYKVLKKEEIAKTPWIQEYALTVEARRIDYS